MAADRRWAIAAAACIAVAAAFAFHALRPALSPPVESLPVPDEPVLATMAPPPPPKAPPSVDGLKLYGLLGSGAVIGGAGVGQRFVPVGREVVPGLTLREVRQHQAILAHSSGTVTLALDGRTSEAEPRPGSLPARVGDSARSRREELLRYRLGFAPRRAGGRVTGFVLRPEADLPLLRRAGLRPGDVLVSVNGQSFDSEERVNELASEIAGSFTAEFEFERGGRRMRTSLEVNPRP